MIYESTARVLHLERLPGALALLLLEAPDIAGAARPGQFVMVRCGDLTLRRPLSVHAAQDGMLALLFRVMGGGTEWLAGVAAGDAVQLTGPLGNGYTLPQPGGRALLLAGGMGIAPLHFLAMRSPVDCDVTLVHGAKSALELYRAPEELRSLMPGVGRLDSIRTLVATDDGSTGVHGSALDVALPLLPQSDQVYLCGPVGMCLAASAYTAVQGDITDEVRLSACSPLALERLAEAQVSLELRMACGVGACYACSISTSAGRRKVCTDGPVFRFGDVLWDEVRT